MHEWTAVFRRDTIRDRGSRVLAQQHCQDPSPWPWGGEKLDFPGSNVHPGFVAEVEAPHPIPLPQGEGDDFSFSPDLKEKQRFIPLSPGERVPEGRVRVARPAQQNTPARDLRESPIKPEFSPAHPGPLAGRERGKQAGPPRFSPLPRWGGGGRLGQ